QSAGRGHHVGAASVQWAPVERARQALPAQLARLADLARCRAWSHRMTPARLRRFVAALLVALASLGLAPIAWGGSYLDRAALMLDEARREGDMLQPRTNDKEMVLVVKALTEARATPARQQEVPTARAR